MPPTTVLGQRRRLPSRLLCLCIGALALGVAALRAPPITTFHAPLWSHRKQNLVQDSASISGVTAPKHPHVVVIVLDDVGYGDIRPWAKNNTIIQTPNIDQLASAGMVLERHYSQVRCSPSRAALMTGRYPIRYGLQSKVLNPVKPYGLPLSESTMPQILKSAGYATHMVGKWHLGFYDWPATPTFRGFDTFFGISEGSDHYNYTMNVGKAKNINNLFWQSRPNCGVGCMVKVERRKNSAILWTEEAVRIVEEHNQSKPLFLYLCYTQPHSPCEPAPEPYAGIYAHVQDAKRRVYAEMLSAADGGIGNVTGALAKRGMLDNTILVVFSDNGGPVGFSGQTSSGKTAEHCEPFGKWGADTGASNYPFRGGKGAAFEGGVRTPALVHYPQQIQGGSRFAGLASVTDWLPTILAAASVSDSADRTALPLDGVNLWSALLTNGPSPRKELLVDIDANGVGTGGALIHNFKKLFVGPIFNDTSFWALPPEVALVQNLAVEDDPIFAPPIRCSEGCVFDLMTDPQEKHPRNATANDADLMDAFRKYQEAAVPSLFYNTPNMVAAIRVYKKLQTVWPYTNSSAAVAS